MSIIDVKNLTFAYPGSYDNIFDNISFRIDTDWKLGFVGRNGMGKTTFLKLLLGYYSYLGQISCSASFSYFPLNIKDRTLITADIVGDDWKIRRELTLLGVDCDLLYRAFNTLSGGEQTKVLLATLFVQDNGFALIDEPTNHLDIEGRKLVSKYLKGKSGFILVSHDRAFLDGCIDHVLSINRSSIQVVQDSFSGWYKNKLQQDEFELAENAKLKKEIKRLGDTAKEKAIWSDRLEETKIGTHQADRGRIGHLAAKMMKRSKAIARRSEEAVSDKQKLLKNIEKVDNLKLNPLIYHSNMLLEFKDVSIYYEDKKIFTPLSFTIERGKKNVFRGKNGSGKSSILKLICGDEICHTGEFFKATGLKISYLPQDTSHLSGSITSYEEQNKLDSTLFRAILRKLNFKRSQFDKRIDDYSEGQKKKLLIAHSLCEQAHLYIWDEPLNYIDIISRIQIEQLLASHDISLLLVEHDEVFCNNLQCDVIDIP